MAMHALAAGDTVPVGKPRNNFVLYESAPRFILVAGGIGITPMISMARRLTVIGKPFELHLCARDQASAPLLAQVTQGPLAKASSVHFDNADGISSCDFRTLLARPDGKAMLYICGPQGFMDHLRRIALDLGWDKARIRVENFTAAIAEEAEQKPFTVTLDRSHREIEVKAEESVIDALARFGFDVPFACMQGTCGTCVTPVLNGEIAHRDAFLGEEEKARMDRMCLCVSRARDRGITLDL